MKEARSSTAGVEFRFVEGVASLRGKHAGQRCAIVGTGTSMDGFDLAKLDRYDFTIALNEAINWYSASYLVMVDYRAIAKVMGRVSGRPDTIALLGEDVVDRLQRMPPYSIRGVVADEAFMGMAERYSFRISASEITGSELAVVGGALSAALSFAVLAGASKCDLYGCDFYRFRNKKYAYSDTESAEYMRTVDEQSDRFITPAMQSMVDGITDHRHLWSSMEVVNKNSLSELRCFGFEPEE